MFANDKHGENIMDIVLKKYGNSTVVVLPPGVLRDLKLSAGSSMSLATTPERTITLAPKRRYTLEELVAQCDLKAAPPADIGAWDSMPTVGRERI